MAELAPDLRPLYTLTSVQVLTYRLHIHDDKPPISISVFTLVVHAYLVVFTTPFHTQVYKSHVGIYL